MGPMNAFVKMASNHLPIKQARLLVVILTSALSIDTTLIGNARTQWEVILLAKTRLVVLNVNV